LDVYPTSGNVQQGNNLLTNITITYIHGSPETITLSASGGPIGTNYFFFNQTGTPTSSKIFTTNLTINVPSSASSNQYLMNITSTSNSGKTHSTSCTLSVLNAEIQVSGTVIAKSSDDIYPTQIQFVSSATNKTYTAVVITTPASPSAAMLIQQGTYSVSLPNQQTYHVICIWTRLVGPWVSPSDAATGTFDGGTLTVNGAAGVTSIKQDYSGYLFNRNLKTSRSYAFRFKTIRSLSRSSTSMALALVDTSQ
jgi:hypothetical protein